MFFQHLEGKIIINSNKGYSYKVRIFIFHFLIIKLPMHLVVLNHNLTLDPTLTRGAEAICAKAD